MVINSITMHLTLILYTPAVEHGWNEKWLNRSIEWDRSDGLLHLEHILCTELHPAVENSSEMFIHGPMGLRIDPSW